MTEDEKEFFKKQIVLQVQAIVDGHTKHYDNVCNNFGNEITKRLTELAPLLTPKTDRLFFVLNSVLNGAVVGISFYIASKLL